MAYRNGTYVAFHAGGTTDPTASDIKYYNIMKAWDAHNKIEFGFVNSHDKTSAVRDDSKPETLERRLKERLGNSKNLVLVVTASTRLDTDWLPLEIRYGVDDCDLPIIAVYPDYRAVFRPALLSGYWPQALATRIENGTAKAIHIPFAKEPLLEAIGQFDIHGHMPLSGTRFYNEAAQRGWGCIYSFEAADQNYAK